MVIYSYIKSFKNIINILIFKIRMFKMVFSQIFTPCRETLTRVRKADKNFIKELGCQNIKFPD